MLFLYYETCTKVLLQYSLAGKQIPIPS